MDLQGGSITTAGTRSRGIYGLHQGSGNIDIDLQGGSITTAGIRSDGIQGWITSTGTGNINIDVRDAVITTESTALDSNGNTLSHGIFGIHLGSGDIDIDIRDGLITTAGTFSYGLYGDHRGSGSVGITSSTDITTTGPNGHGIVAYQRSTTASPRNIDVRVNGGTIDVQGTGAQGIRIGTVSGGVPQRVATLDDEGFRRQQVVLNGEITSAGEGVFLANGGRVTIGPQGRIDSDSGIAILATGTVPEDSTDMSNVIAAIPPRLRVDLNPDGAQMTGEGGWLATALGGGWIMNDGGETTIAVNNVVLHDGITGATRRTAPQRHLGRQDAGTGGDGGSQYGSVDPQCPDIGHCG